MPQQSYTGSNWPRTTDLYRMERQPAAPDPPVDLVFVIRKGDKHPGLASSQDTRPGHPDGGRRLLDVLPGPHMRLGRRLIEQAFRTGRQERIEYQVQARTLAQEYEARIIPRGSEHVVLIVSDVSQRKRAEASLSESEAHFRSIFETAPMAIRVSSGEFHVFANPAYVKMSGYESDKELLGRPVLDLAAPRSRAVLKAVLKRRAAHDRKPASFQSVVLRKDGLEVPVQVFLAVYERLGKVYSVAHIWPVGGRAKGWPATRPGAVLEGPARVSETGAPSRASVLRWNESGFSSLSRRQREVLQLIAEGKSTKEAAAALGISFKTADSHRTSLMHKLDAHETATLVRMAVHFGLVTS